jgi:hypothetical protein
VCQCNDRFSVTRRAGGPDGIIGTNVGGRSSKISRIIFELKVSYMDPSSGLLIRPL